MTIYDETLNIYRSKKNRKEKTCFMIHVFFGLTAHSSNLDSLLNFKWSPFYKPQGIPYDCSSLMHYDDQVHSHMIVYLVQKTLETKFKITMK